MPAKKAPSTSTNDAVAMLTADHRAVEALFERFSQARDEDDDDTCAALVQQICDELTIHTTIEEEIFYPAVQAAIDDDDLMDEAEVEHASARDLIDQLEEMEPGDPLFAAKVTVLGEYVKHHVGEEENEMFKQARAAAKEGGLDLGELGTALKERKGELRAELQVDEDAEAEE